MTSFYGSVNGGQGGSGEGVDTSTLMQKNNPTFNGTITGPNARFTGTVQIPEPTEDNHAATKGYVDAALADVDLSEVTTKMDAIETAQDELAAQLDDKVDAENPAFTGTATLNGKNIATVDQIPNISDLPYLDENNPTYTGTLAGADATFSGVVSVPTPTQDGQAVNKQYVDQAIDGVQTEVDLSEVQADIAELQTVKLDKANPTYTGSLTGENAAFSGTVTVATPAAEGEAANKGYVDAAKTELEGDINTLQQTVANQTETINTLNQQVTNITGGTAELPYLKNTGDSGTGVYDFTGATVNAADPVDNSNVATKHYVDQKIASSGGTGEVVSYTQGDGISISPENEISLSIDSAGANGLKVGTNGLGLDLATNTTSGAMAASDKIAIASNTTEITNIKDGTTELPYLKETNPTYEGTLIGGDATFTGSVQVSTPDQDNEAANKGYVDTALAEAKSYTDEAVSGIASDETIQQIQSDIENIKDGTTVLPYLSSAGGTVTGPIKYGTSPKDTSDLANKAYVDAIHVQAVADAKNYTDSEITNLENGTTELPYIKNNGDTITGSYDLTGAAVTIAEPTENSNPATKKYVDDSISAIDVSEQIAPLTERVTAAEGEIDTLQTGVEAVETSVTNITSGTTELPYVKDSGDTVTGTYNFTGANVTIAEPTVSNNPATKNYVDTKIASAGGSGEVVSYTQGNGINISPENIISVVIAADNANGLAVDTSGIKLNVATSTTAGAMSAADKAKLDASSTTEQMNQAISSAIDETLEDPTKLPFVNINGDTMHGSLTTTELFTDFVTIRNAGTDGNTGFQNNSDTDHIRVYDKVADTLVPIEVGEPVNNQDASTKKYVDDKVTTETAARTEAIESLDEAKADKNNPTFTGTLSGANATLSGTLTGNTATFSGGITVPLEPGAEGSATSKKYVDDQIAAIDVSEQISPLTQRVTTAEGEIDTLQSDMTTVKSNVGTINTNITNITNGTTELPYIPSDGGTISGPINWGGNPQEATELANKAYVDANDSDAVNSAKEYTNAQIEIAKGYTDEAVTNLTNGTTKLPYVTKEEVDIAADTRDVARAYRYTFNDGLDGTNSNAGFGFIDFTPAIVTEVDRTTSFSPLYVGEPKKDTQAATKKYVDDAIAAVDIPEYTLAKQAAAEDGYFATYYLTKDSVQVGEKINIPKDYLVKEAELLEVAATDTPYSGAVIGDKYIDFTINTQASDEDEQHIYLPVKDLVDVYTGGNGININASNVVSVQIDAANANGLALGSAGLKLNLATTSAAGAMSAADKTKLNTAISEEQLTAVENEVDTLQTEVNNIKSGTTDLGYLKATDPTYTGTLNGVNATFTGDVIVPTPDGDTEAANKSYVDTAVNAANTEIANIKDGTTGLPYIKNTGDTVSGTYNFTGSNLTIAEPTENNNPATKGYVDEAISTIDGSTQIEPLTERVTAAEGEIDTLQTEVSNIKNGTTTLSYMKVADPNYTGTMTGVNATFSGNVVVPTPDADNEAANKQYVDTTETALREDISEVQQSVMQQTGTIDILSQTMSAITQGTMALPYVKKVGDTMSGELVIDTAESEELFNGHTEIGGGYASFKDSADANYALYVGSDGHGGYPLIDFSVNKGNSESIYIQPENTTVLGVQTDTGYANVRLADPVEDDDAATKRYVDNNSNTAIAHNFGQGDDDNDVNLEAKLMYSDFYKFPTKNTFNSLTLYGKTEVVSPTIYNLTWLQSGYYNANGDNLTDENGIAFIFDAEEGVSTYYVSYRVKFNETLTSLNYSYAITEYLEDGSVYGTYGGSGAVPNITIKNTNNQPSATTRIAVSIYGTSFDKTSIGDAIEAGYLVVGNDYIASPDHPKEIMSAKTTENTGIIYSSYNFFLAMYLGFLGSPNLAESYATERQQEINISNELNGFTLKTAGFNPTLGSKDGIDVFSNGALTNAGGTVVYATLSDKYDYANSKYTKNIGSIVINGENADSVLSIAQIPTYIKEGMTVSAGTPIDAIKISVDNCVSGNPISLLGIVGTETGSATDFSLNRASIAAPAYFGDTFNLASSHFEVAPIAAMVQSIIKESQAEVISPVNFYDKIFYGISMPEDFIGEYANEEEYYLKYYSMSLDGGIYFISDKITTVEQAVSYFTSNPLVVKYILNEPEEYAIPEEDLLSYNNLNKRIESNVITSIIVAPKNEEETSSSMSLNFAINYNYNSAQNTNSKINQLEQTLEDKINNDIDLVVEKRKQITSWSDDGYTFANHGAMDYNTLYIFDKTTAIPTLTIESFDTPSDTSYVYTYHFIFRSGATPTVLTLPPDVILPDGFEIEANRIYEINIMENLLSYQSWPVE